MHSARVRARVIGLMTFVVALGIGATASADDAKKNDRPYGPNPWKDKGGVYDEADSKDSESKPISVAPIVGYGTNHLNLGVGVRAGYTLPQHFYLGGTFVYHFGESAGDLASVHLFYPAGEVGYDVHMENVTIRPYAGAGLLVAQATVLKQTATETAFGFYPGLNANYEVPRSPVFVGADIRLLFNSKGGDPSFGAFAVAGARF